MSRRERQLLEELLQEEVGRRLPELWALARELHRRDWGRPQVLRRTMRDVSSFIRSSGFTLRTVAPHINEGFAGVATGRAPGPHVLIAAPFAHGAVATAMAVGAASVLSALRMRWPGEVTVLVLPPRWKVDALNQEVLPLADHIAAIGATVGRSDGLAAPTTFRTEARIVFHQRPGADGGASAGDSVSVGAGGFGADALQLAVQAYQEATARAESLPDSQRITAELHTRQTSRRGVSLAELHLRLEALDEAGVAELVEFAHEVARRRGGTATADPISVGGGAEAAAASNGEEEPAWPPVTAPLTLWRKVGRLPSPTGGWDAVPNDLTGLNRFLPVGVAVLGIGKAPGDPGFAQAIWGGQGERALRDGVTLLAWQAAHMLTDPAARLGRDEAAATAPAVVTEVTEGTD